LDQNLFCGNKSEGQKMLRSITASRAVLGSKIPVRNAHTAVASSRWSSASASKFAAAAAVAVTGGVIGVNIRSASSRANCEEAKAPKMYYRMLGNTGLQVSVLSYGFWATFGAKSDLSDREGIEMAKKCLRVARNAGINLFDNAEVYGTPNGEAERIMGVALKELREEDPFKSRCLGSRCFGLVMV
jgi:hypothetical protein